MTSSLAQQHKLLQYYSVQDLSRTLVRQYLYQHNMFKTLNCFQNQDKQNSKKIVKSTLIKMLSMNNLVVNNKKKQKQTQHKSLIMILVQYLRDKFQERIHKQTVQDNKFAFQKNKQLSMNGDQIIKPYQNNNKNILQYKTSKIKDSQKTFTQQNFYKKADGVNNQDDKKIKKQSSVKNYQKSINSRPSTAKPSTSIQPQRISALYSKLNSNENKNQSSQSQNLKVEDQIQIFPNPSTEIVNLKLKQDKKEINNKIITSNISQNINTKDKAKKQEQVYDYDFQQNQHAIKDKKEPVKGKQNNSSFDHPPAQNNQNSNKKQTTNLKVEQQKIQQKAKSKVQQPKKTIIQQTKQIKKVQKSKDKNQVQEQYFQEFQQASQNSKFQNIHPQDTINQNKISQKISNANIINQEPKQQAFIKSNRQQQNTSKLQNKISEVTAINKSQQNQIEKIKKQEATTSQIGSSSQHNNKIVNQNSSQNYLPTQGPRTMKKLLRKTGKQITTADYANQVIGSNIKTLDQEMLSRQKQKNQKSDSTKQQQIKKQAQRQQNISVNQIIPKDNQVKVELKSSKQIINPDKKQIQNSTKSNMMKLKKKVKNAIEQQVKPTSKFKFDDNFVDQPINGNKEKYPYEQFLFQKMTIKPQLKPKNSCAILSTSINYDIKPSTNVESSNIAKKKNQKPIPFQRSQQLKKIVYQKGSPYLAKAWHQGFILSPFKQTFYGLKQIQGGPCGIIAAVQCYFLKHLMYLSKPKSQNDLKNQLRRESCLVAALTDILWKAKGNKQKIILVIPSNRKFSGPKLQISNLIEVQIEASSFENVYECMWGYKSSFIGQSNHGVTILIYSIVLTKGIQNIQNQIDMKENPLIGHHGHCTQQLVNLFISGQASSNCFDGKKQLQGGLILHGIQQKSQFGFLTVFQTLQYIQVGKNLKNPIFPIWVISKQFHYHVTFGNHYLIAENNDCEKFDLIYFDGLYACDKFIRLTFDKMEKDEFGMVKQSGNIKNLPLIEQVLLKKWGRRKVDWNGSTKIL